MHYYDTLVSPEQLYALLPDRAPVIVDCRHELADPEAGRRAYAKAHLPGAIFAHLDEDLSGPIVPGRTGRHPLPAVTRIIELFGRWGIGAGRQVVVYDDKGGAIAARLWWMLQWLGHARVAVLDGGLPAWVAAGYPLSAEVPPPQPTLFVPQPHTDWVVSREEVETLRRDDRYRLIDARAAERYRGEVEPIDPVAGHIDGATNLPFGENLAHGRLRSAEELRERFASNIPAERTVFYCGSGVTACHDILAYRHAGLGMPRLYPGSWSEWIVG